MSNNEMVVLLTGIENDGNNQMLSNFYTLLQQSTIKENTDIILECLDCIVREEKCEYICEYKFSKFIEMNYMFVNFLQCIK